MTSKAFALQQLRQLQQCVLFIVDEEQLLARSVWRVHRQHLQWTEC
jgi:hypothetical protein